MVTEPRATLKPLIVVLGGVRMTGVKVQTGATTYRQRTKRRSRRGGESALEFHTHERRIIQDADAWRDANRFVKNANSSLKEYTVRTPLGRIAVATMKPYLSRFREECYQAATEHNPKNSDWQIRVELSWADLGADAISQLLTLMAEDLPPSFWEQS